MMSPHSITGGGSISEQSRATINNYLMNNNNNSIAAANTTTGLNIHYGLSKSHTSQSQSLSLSPSIINPSNTAAMIEFDRNYRSNHNHHHHHHHQQLGLLTSTPSSILQSHPSAIQTSTITPISTTVASIGNNVHIGGQPSLSTSFNMAHYMPYLSHPINLLQHYAALAAVASSSSSSTSSLPFTCNSLFNNGNSSSSVSSSSPSVHLFGSSPSSSSSSGFGLSFRVPMTTIATSSSTTTTTTATIKTNVEEQTESEIFTRKSHTEKESFSPIEKDRLKIDHEDSKA